MIGQPPQAPSLPAGASWLLHPLGLIALWAVLVLSALWLRPLLPIDETRYLSVAWEMWLRGVQQDPSDFLAIKFAMQLGTRETPGGQDP